MQYFLVGTVEHATCHLYFLRIHTGLKARLYKPLSQSCAEQRYGFGWRANTICTRDGLDEESEKINNY